MSKIKIHQIAVLASLLCILLCSTCPEANFSKKLQTVQPKNYTYKQKLEWQADCLFSLQYTIVQISHHLTRILKDLIPENKPMKKLYSPTSNPQGIAFQFLEASYGKVTAKKIPPCTSSKQIV